MNTKVLLMTGVLGTLALASACTHPRPVPTALATALTPPTVPPALAVPGDAQVVAHFHATGAQVYACTVGAAGGTPSYTWTLKRPDATLTDQSGTNVGIHGAGPTWTATDGSAVVGKKVAQTDAPDVNAIPWLLLRAVSTSGKGVFAGVSFIQRVDTVNGKAPATGCGVTTVDTEARAEYSAEYYFYRGASQ